MPSTPEPQTTPGANTAYGIFPRLVLDADAVENNIGVMSAWVRSRGARLAPHIKTTMTRQIVERQVAGGAVAVSVATLEQALVARSWGCRRIIIANEVVDPLALNAIRELLEDDEGLDISCFVDSFEGLRRAADAFWNKNVTLPVVIDIGMAGARAGVRDAGSARALGEETARTGGLRLVGVGGYEGVTGTVRDNRTLRAVDEHCARTASVFELCADLFETDAPLFTMGGSVFLDRVVANAPRASAGRETEIVLRPGCYVTHDHGMYAEATPVAELTPAVVVEALVLSTPEPDLAVAGAGRRDLAYDAGMPTVLSDATPDAGQASARVDHLFDHHAVIRRAGRLRIGDVVRLGISHPCSIFDRYTGMVATSRFRGREWWETDFDRHHSLPNHRSA